MQSTTREPSRQEAQGRRGWFEKFRRVGAGWAITIGGLLAIFAVLPGSAACSEAVRTSGSTEFATFAGGCFWCVESDFEHLEGVVSAVSGYTGGHTRDPTYKETSAGGTGHAEAVRIEYDPDRITYEQLLEVFWRNIDPSVEDRQFCDKGSQYRSAIFTHNPAQRQAAEESLRRLEQNKPFEGEIFTQINDASDFYEAEEYHQDYAEKNPIRYKLYRRGCGRDHRLEEIWGD